MDLEIYGTVDCQSCGQYKPWTYMVQIRQDGGKHILKVCLSCKDRATEGWTGRDTVITRGVDPDTLPVHTPEWKSGDHLTYCVRCGKEGAQNHHFAPRSLFPDADEWPQGYLCEKHHTQWHNALDVEIRRNARDREFIRDSLRLMIERLERTDDDTA